MLAQTMLAQSPATGKCVGFHDYPVAGDGANLETGLTWKMNRIGLSPGAWITFVVL